MPHRGRRPSHKREHNSCDTLLGKRNSFAHEDPNQFSSRFTRIHGIPPTSDYTKWFSRYNALVTRSREEFVAHYERKYGLRSHIPIWMAIELWDFGTLSFALAGLRIADQKAIANRFSLPDGRLLISWIKTLNQVRNAIAHHGRLRNANLLENPVLPRLGEISDFDPLLSLPGVVTRMYSVCCILCYLTNVINQQSSWIDNLKTLLKAFPVMPHAQIQNMGFPSDWETHGFWNYGAPATAVTRQSPASTTPSP
jgi:abortive infection bacteriophage resistance protein